MTELPEVEAVRFDMPRVKVVAGLPAATDAPSFVKEIGKRKSFVGTVGFGSVSVCNQLTAAVVDGP